jgi:hypothetical protein
MSKVDITSTILEKGFDSARSFVGKLINPAIEEVGLLLKDHVAMWKFNNQIKMLNKAKAICEKNGVPIKTISLKLLCPLLDYSSLEEDNFLQERWVHLLVNMVDSRKNIKNHVFPYILSQISETEFKIIESAYNKKVDRVKFLEVEFEKYNEAKLRVEPDLTRRSEEIERELALLEKDYTRNKEVLSKLNEELFDLEERLHEFSDKDDEFRRQFALPALITPNTLHGFEVANVVRLGLVKEISESFVQSKALEIPHARKRSISVDLDIDIERHDNLVLTELGELFIEACNESKSD